MEETIDLRPYLATLGRYFWLIGGAIALAIALSVGFYMLSDEYQAIALVTVPEPAQELQFDPRIVSNTRPGQLLEVYPELAKSSDLLERLLVTAEEITEGRITTLARLRPALALSKADVLPIDRGLALHPALGGFKTLYERGHLAIVQGVGYPNPDFSHFRATEIWEAGDPNGGSSGWIGRYLDTIAIPGSTMLDAINIGFETPAVLATASGHRLADPPARRGEPDRNPILGGSGSGSAERIGGPRDSRNDRNFVRCDVQRGADRPVRADRERCRQCLLLYDHPAIGRWTTAHTDGQSPDDSVSDGACTERDRRGVCDPGQAPRRGRECGCLGWSSASDVRRRAAS